MMQKSVYSKLVINNVTSAAVKSKVAENLPPMPAKNKTNLAKTPLFSRFLSNSRRRISRKRNDVLVKNTSSDHGSFYSWLA